MTVSQTVREVEARGPDGKTVKERSETTHAKSGPGEGKKAGRVQSVEGKGHVKVNEGSGH